MKNIDEREGEAPAEPLPKEKTAHREVRPPDSIDEWEGEAPAEPLPQGKTAHREVRPPMVPPSEEPSLPRRKRPAHGIHFEGNSPVIVFLSACTKDRHEWLATEECHALLVDVWTAASTWLVGRYVVMPDHIHLFAAPGECEIDLEKWVKYWKSMFTRRYKARDHQWQSGYWDVRLRDSESYDEKWEYVRNNPVRHGLVERAEDWPFQGEIHILDW